MTQSSLPLSREHLTSPLRIFVNRLDAYAIGFKGTDRAGYRKINRAVTDELLARHLSGDITIGMYCLNTRNECRWVCFDFDENTREDFNKASTLYKYLDKHGFKPLAEFSGGGQFKMHIWVFCEPTPAATLRKWAAKVCVETGVRPHEIFPKQDVLSEAGYGNLVKMPLSKHPFTGQWCELCDIENQQRRRDADFLQRWLA